MKKTNTSKLNRYSREAINDQVKKLAKYVEDDDKSNFKKLADQLIDTYGMIVNDDFLYLFGILATQLYSSEKLEFLNQLEYYKKCVKPKVTDNKIDKEIVANIFDKEFESLYVTFQTLLESRGYSEDFKDELHGDSLDLVFNYYDLNIRFRKPGEFLNQKNVTSIVNTSLQIISLFKEVLLSQNYKPNVKYTQQMFDHYRELKKQKYTDYEAGYETLEKYFGKDAATVNRISSFCRIARSPKKR